MIKRNPYISFMRKNAAIEKHFPEDLQVPIDLWPEAKVRAYQYEAIKEIIEFAYTNNVYYRDKYDSMGVSPSDFEKLEDISKFPFLEKDELRGKPWRLLSIPRSKISQIHMSTGTTSKSAGDHIYSIFSWDDIYVNELAIEMPIMVHSSPDDIVIIALPYEMSSAAIAFHRSFQHGTGAAVVNTGKGGVYADPLKTLMVMRDLEAEVLMTTPPYAMYLSEIGEENGIDVKGDMHLKYMWLTGEGCSNNYRKRLEDIYGVKAFMYYGSLEGGPIGVECIEQDGYHISEGHVYVEIIDPNTLEVLDPGMVGEVVITVLYRKAMPLIRYRIGDLGFIDDGPCPCCIERNKLHLRGRKSDQIRILGKDFSPYYLEDKLYSIPEVGNSYKFQIKNEELIILTELNRKMVTNDVESVREKIRNRIGLVVGEVKDVVIVERLERSLKKTTRVEYLDH